MVLAWWDGVALPSWAHLMLICSSKCYFRQLIASIVWREDGTGEQRPRARAVLLLWTSLAARSLKQCVDHFFRLRGGALDAVLRVNPSLESRRHPLTRWPSILVSYPPLVFTHHPILKLHKSSTGQRDRGGRTPRARMATYIGNKFTEQDSAKLVRQTGSCSPGSRRLAVNASPCTPPAGLPPALPPPPSQAALSAARRPALPLQKEFEKRADPNDRNAQALLEEMRQHIKKARPLEAAPGRGIQRLPGRLAASRAGWHASRQHGWGGGIEKHLSGAAAA